MKLVKLLFIFLGLTFTYADRHAAVYLIPAHTKIKIVSFYNGYDFDNPVKEMVSLVVKGINLFFDEAIPRNPFILGPANLIPKEMTDIFGIREITLHTGHETATNAYGCITIWRNNDFDILVKIFPFNRTDGKWILKSIRPVVSGMMPEANYTSLIS